MTGEQEGGGISITYASDHNVVRDNTLCGGMGRPLWIENSSYNLIDHNFVPSYGIKAVEGVKSGVNYATGNGNPLQCLNVVRGPPGSSPPDPSGPRGPPGPAAPPGQSGNDGGAPRSHADFTPPLVALAGIRTQKVRKALRVAVSATSEDLWVTTRGKISIAGAGRSYRLMATARRFVAHGEKLTLKLALPAAARRAARRALNRGRRVKATLRVHTTDAAGNRSVNKRRIRFTL